MRFLADESCDQAVVDALQHAGHDVKTVREWRRGAQDAAVIDLARAEKRILLTEDKDFGRLFFASVGPPTGVVLIRYPAKERSRLVEEVSRVIEAAAPRLSESFVVVQPGRIRIVARLKEPPSQ